MRGMRFLFYLFIFLLFLSVGIIFGIQNSQPVHIRFLYWEAQPFPLWVFVLGAGLIGMLITGSICFVEFLKMHLAYRQAQKSFDRVRRA